MKFRHITRIVALASLSTVLSAAAGPLHHESAPAVTVFKDPNCGCCTEWVAHLRRHGMTVTTRDTNDLDGIKSTARVPASLHSCHTAFVAGYVVEGHVPASDIARLLETKPRVAGIGVGGMPIGSPGMEMGDRKDPYVVMAFTRDGRTSVFARH